MKRLLPIVVAGLFGYATFAFLASTTDPYADAGYRLDRGEAIRMGHEFATRLGIDATAWWAAVRTTQAPIATDFRRMEPDVAESSIAEVRTEVRLTSPDGKEYFLATLAPDGSLISFSRDEPKTAPLDPVSSDDESGPLAKRGLELLVGPRVPSFSPLSDPLISEKGVELTWEARKSSENLSSVKATVRVRKGRVVEASLEPVYSAAFRAERRTRDDTLTFVIVAGVLLTFVLVLVGFSSYVIGTLDRLIDHRRMLGPLGFLLLLWFLSLLGGAALDQIVTQGMGYPLATLIHSAFFLLVVVPSFLALWGGGTVLARRGKLAPTLTCELLTEGQVLSRPVGASAAAGLLAGGVLAAMPSLIIASGLFPAASLNPMSPVGWVGRMVGVPGLGVLWEGPCLVLATYFGLLRPLLDTHVSRRIVSTTLSALGGVALFTTWPFQHSLQATLIGACLTLLVGEWVYGRWGLLAILFAGVAAGLAAKTASLLLQPSPALWHGGLVNSLLLVAAIVASLAVAWFGREVSVEDEIRLRAQRAAESLSQTKAVRESLLAEFAVARHAQQLMLPARPPSLPGFDLSTICRPAREVGGDLFDFLPLSDDRWGVVVADVAGKGVPAALYMTLAKGLLASICETHHASQEIALELNRHFHFSGRRSVFVTMALGVVDPSTGRVECVRAGHNPLIWRRAASNETIPLKPSGIGLGLTPNRLFQRSLQVETIRMEPGDALFFYSDGVTEAMNAENEEYGDDRLAKVISEADGLDADQTRDAILADLGLFVGDTPANDDITLVVLRMRGNGSISQADPGSLGYPSRRRPTVEDQGSEPPDPSRAGSP